MVHVEAPGGEAQPSSWVARAADRAPSVRSSRERSMQRAQQIVQAARRLITTGGDFTTHQLAREAGIAIQTLYKHFAGKDEVMLAVLEDVIGDSMDQLRRQGLAIADPVERLRFYVFSTMTALDDDSGRLIPVEHWRLVQLYPDEVEQARRPVADLFATALQEAREAGLLAPADVAHAAALTNQLLLAEYHQQYFARRREPGAVIAARLWAFLLPAYGGGLPASAPVDVPVPSPAAAPVP
ncbi:TetR/AcrR family transcriptional regulator [Trujillonella endophytica]|uniref:Transcriptional regulator, TetR family n=1 Tax=Trujillonella endophytica TaxID=673521 RepID=A0A1H8QL70_9ACTN|nr:TetR/AcrR family transcriptional regulator [Trujillella endophytica]SEO54979.1 transcriptional regulator, TetR family [Trujillella endophytica]